MNKIVEVKKLNDLLPLVEHDVIFDNIQGSEFYLIKAPGIHVFNQAMINTIVEDSLYTVAESFNYCNSTHPWNFNTINSNDITESSTLYFKETCVSLSSPWSFNFFHWCEELLKVFWIEKIGYRPSYIVPGNSAIYRNSLVQLGIPDERIIVVNGQNLWFSSFIIARNIRLQHEQLKPLARELREVTFRLISSKAGANPDCFAVRKQGGLTFSPRKIANQKEVETFCQTEGIDLLDAANLEFEDQVSRFRSCSILASIHGGVFVQQLWMPQHSSIIECFSPNFINLSSFNIANMLENRYFMISNMYIVNQMAAPDLDNIVVPINQLKKAFDTARLLRKDTSRPSI